MKSTGRIAYILSDLDGVIRHFPPQHTTAIEKKFGIPKGYLHSVAFEKPLLTKAICGIITDEIWRIEIAASLSQFMKHELAVLAVKEWTDFPGIIDHQYLDWVASHFAHIPMALLTNATTRLMSDLETLQIHKRFFTIFNSSEIGYCKPDRKLFIHVCERLACSPSKLLFIDDSFLNIESAAAFGLRTCHYRDFNEFKTQILEMLF